VGSEENVVGRGEAITIGYFSSSSHQTVEGGDPKPAREKAEDEIWFSPHGGKSKKEKRV